MSDEFEFNAEMAAIEKALVAWFSSQDIPLRKAVLIMAKLIAGCLYLDFDHPEKPLKDTFSFAQDLLKRMQRDKHV